MKTVNTVASGCKTKQPPTFTTQVNAALEDKFPSITSQGVLGGTESFTHLLILEKWYLWQASVRIHPQPQPVT